MINQHLIAKDTMQAVRLVAVSPLFVGFGYWVIQVITDFGDRYAFGAYLCGWALIVIFLTVFIYQTYHLFGLPKYPLVINQSGTTDTRTSLQLIPWKQISNVAKKGEFVCLTLRRKFSEQYCRSKLARYEKWRRKDVGPSHVLLSVAHLKTTRDELFELISQVRAQA